MHAVKVILLLLLTLAMMRVASWSLGWVLKNYTKSTWFWIAITSNISVLIAVACILVTQQIPDEFIVPPALVPGRVPVNITVAAQTSNEANLLCNRHADW